MALHSISLFSGAGMLDEGLRAGLAYLGIPHRTVCHVEREAHAASILVARMEDGSLDAAPVWSDVTTFDAGAFRGRVDFVAAGFPCQDLSVAGRRAGLDGKRSGLFFTVLDVADACGASGLFLENVGGIATATASVVDAAEGELDERAAARVLGELADRGWDAEWLTLSASDVGASHGRLRWFCLAWRRVANADSDQLRTDGGRSIAWPDRRHDAAGGCPGLAHACESGRRLAPGADAAGQRSVAEQSGSRRSELGGDAVGRPQQLGSQLADAQCCGDRGEEPAPHHREPEGDGSADRPGRRGGALLSAVADAGSRGRPGTVCGVGGCGRTACVSRCAQADDAARRGAPLFAPGPADRSWADILATAPWLAPALSVEEHHDAAAAFEAAEPVLRGVADGLADGLDFDQRAPRLKACGNGVVALQAAAAFVVLAQRAGAA